LATAYVVLRFNPGLLVERLGPRQGAKAWDTAILSLLGVLQLGRCILAGLDQRFGWSPAFPLAVQLASLAVCLLGYALFVWAMASNAFFSQIVRVQTERGHTVARGGPYRWVRHPAYLGALVVELAAAGLLGSWWVLLVGVLNAGLFVLRAALEDRALLHELPGYAEYARQVRWRLLPGIW
jgi:protein-S-isoprenylcysteine O-methyltransferase Ste14